MTDCHFWVKYPFNIMHFQGGKMRTASGQCKPQNPFPFPLLPNPFMCPSLSHIYCPFFKKQKVQAGNKGKSKTQTHVALRHTSKPTET